MANKEKTVDLKPKAEKISKEDLTRLQHLVNTINGGQFNIGKIETQKHKILHDLSLAQDRVAKMQDHLVKEYGSYDVNLTDGTINWPKEPDTDSVEKPKEDEK